MHWLKDRDSSTTPCYFEGKTARNFNLIEVTCILITYVIWFSFFNYFCLIIKDVNEWILMVSMKRKWWASRSQAMREIIVQCKRICTDLKMNWGHATWANLGKEILPLKVALLGGSERYTCRKLAKPKQNLFQTIHTQVTNESAERIKAVESRFITWYPGLDISAVVCNRFINYSLIL